MTENHLERARILLVGSGRMGSALLGGWLVRGLAPANTYVVEPATAGLDWAREAGVACVADRSALPADLAPDVVVFAVKPQLMDEVAPGYGDIVAGGAAVLSIAAGTRIAFFERLFGADAPVVRAMPNTPAAIGQGMTVLVANGAVTDAQRDLARTLLSAVGAVDWVEDEALINAVTAVSGSGPAYVFLLIEAMTDAGVAFGLPQELAAKLARTTVGGAGALAMQSDEPADVLRRNVTSPGGTTAAALEILMRERGGLGELMHEAIAAAERRSRELAS